VGIRYAVQGHRRAQANLFDGCLERLRPRKSFAA
jgi:hypothetical protein